MHRPFTLVGCILLILGGVAFSVMSGLVTPFTPPAPASWHQVHVGMQRSNILALVGAAQASGYPEKIAETWYRDGTLGLRRLVVWYQNYPDERASSVQEFIYWRPSRRYIHTRSEP